MGKRQNELGEQKYFANRGIARNKSILPNIRIKVEIRKELINPSEEAIESFKEYKFKDEGYINVFWTKSLDRNGEEPLWNLDTRLTVHGLKEFLGEKQWCKFCQGKRKFIIQRRVDGRNIPLNKNI